MQVNRHTFDKGVVAESADAGLYAAHLKESRTCVNEQLQEVHLQAIRKHASVLAKRETALFQTGQTVAATTAAATSTAEATTAAATTTAEATTAAATTTAATTNAATTTAAAEETTPAPATTTAAAETTPAAAITTAAATTPAAETTSSPEEPTTVAPTTAAPTEPPTTEAPDVDATLDAAGFKEVTARCCPNEVETFFNRLLDSMGYVVCSKRHVQGLMHWFTCVPDMDFQYVLDVIENGNPCKYWAPKGDVCPALSPECQGHWCR